MKRLIQFLLIPITFLLITACDSSDDPITPTPQGNIYITSNPAGATIWLDGTSTSRITPDTIKNIDEGVRTITLKLQDYNDTTFSVSVVGNQTSVVTNVVLVSNIMATLFGPIKIYETQGTSANQPSGLDLSSGNAYGVSSDSNRIVDIYYSSSVFLVQSADLYPNLVRGTDFFVGSGAATNLFDGVDSPLRNTGTWTSSIQDRESNYVFLYDHDGHYSKLKIVNYGGGVPGEPAWVEVQWYYNTVLLDNRF